MVKFGNFELVLEFLVNLEIWVFERDIWKKLKGVLMVFGKQ